MEKDERKETNLTPRQMKFCDEYVKIGNATEAYRRAGYKGIGNTIEASASRLLRNDKVKHYIAQRNKELANERIAGMQEVKEFWSEVLRDREKAEIKDRLKASEYIAKTNAAFIEKHEHSGIINLVINHRWTPSDVAASKANKDDSEE